MDEPITRGTRPRVARTSAMVAVALLRRIGRLVRRRRAREEYRAQ